MTIKNDKITLFKKVIKKYLLDIKMYSSSDRIYIVSINTYNDDYYLVHVRKAFQRKNYKSLSGLTSRKIRIDKINLKIWLRTYKILKLKNNIKKV